MRSNMRPKLIVSAVLIISAFSTLGSLFAQEINPQFDVPFDIGETQIVISKDKDTSLGAIRAPQGFLEIDSRDPRALMVRVADYLYSELLRLGENGRVMVKIVPDMFLPQNLGNLTLPEMVLAYLAGIARYDLAEFYEANRIKTISINLDGIFPPDRIGNSDARTVLELFSKIRPYEAMELIGEIRSDQSVVWTREALRLKMVDAIEAELKKIWSSNDGRTLSHIHFGTINDANEKAGLENGLTRTTAKIMSSEIINEALNMQTHSIEVIRQGMDIFAGRGFESFVDLYLGIESARENHVRFSQSPFRDVFVNAAKQGFNVLASEIRTRGQIAGVNEPTVFDLMAVSPRASQVEARTSVLQSELERHNDARDERDARVFEKSREGRLARARANVNRAAKK